MFDCTKVRKPFERLDELSKSKLLLRPDMNGHCAMLVSKRDGNGWRDPLVAASAWQHWEQRQRPGRAHGGHQFRQHHCWAKASFNWA